MDNIFNFVVDDRKSFSEFILLLHTDLRNNPDKWENKSLEDFLESLSRYSEDIQGYYDNTEQNINADVPAWSTFADLFKGAIMYE